MKFWGCLFLIVTASGSGEPNGSSDPTNQELLKTTVLTEDPAPSNQTLTPPPTSGAVTGSSRPQLTSSTPQSQTPTTENTNITRDQTTTTDKPSVTTQEVTAALEPFTNAGKEDKATSNWVYIFLAVILLMILVLVVILYLLQRSSRTYSFDFHRPLPVNHPSYSNETFGPIYLDDLSPPPVDSKITSLKPGETDAKGEGAPQEKPIPNGLETTLTGNTNTSLDSTTNSPVSSTHLFLGDMGEEPLKENDDTPLPCSGDSFFDISLDVKCEVASCDDLLELN